MSKFRLIAGLFIVLILLAGLWFLFDKTRVANFEVYGEIESILHRLKQLDESWNVDVLKSKTGTDQNYDSVASSLQSMEALNKSLSEQTGKLWGDSRDIKVLLSDYQEVMGKKIAAIDHFKSQNAILRNSQRFLPLAEKELVDSVQGGKLADSVKTKVERSAHEVLSSAMAFMQTTDAASKAAVITSTVLLKNNAVNISIEAQEKLIIFINHAETVVNKKETGDKLLEEITTLPTSKTIDELIGVYQKHFSSAQEGVHFYRQLLLAYSLLLAFFFLFYLGVRSYRLLREKNKELHKVNQQLGESQMALVQSEKMSALGKMVAGVAHEINTPLAYVKGTLSAVTDYTGILNGLAKQAYHYSSSAQHQNKDGHKDGGAFEQLAETAKSIEEQKIISDLESLLKDSLYGIDQISEIVLNLKNFSRLDRAKVTSYSVEEGLDSTLLIAKNLLKNKVEVKKEYGHPPAITCSPSQINQVFLNVITNAVHAMPEARNGMGVITIRTSSEKKGMVKIEIQDNGIGIAQDVLPKIFDPFFTTKEIGKGTGMGLSISYKIIQEHGGQVLVESHEGNGATFTILLPVHLELSQENSEGKSEVML